MANPHLPPGHSPFMAVLLNTSDLCQQIAPPPFKVIMTPTYNQVPAKKWSRWEMSLLELHSLSMVVSPSTKKTSPVTMNPPRHSLVGFPSVTLAKLSTLSLSMAEQRSTTRPVLLVTHSLSMVVLANTSRQHQHPLPFLTEAMSAFYAQKYNGHRT